MKDEERITCAKELSGAKLGVQSDRKQHATLFAPHPSYTQRLIILANEEHGVFQQYHQIQ